jgi:hypothetical protein
MVMQKKLFIFLVVCHWIFFFSGCEPPTPEERAAQEKERKRKEEIRKEYGDRYEVWKLARQYVRGQLLSPSTASFPWENPAKRIGHIWLVESHVDAQNMFGAEIRNNFFVKMQYLDGNYKLLRIVIGDKVCYVAPTVFEDKNIASNENQIIDNPIPKKNFTQKLNDLNGTQSNVNDAPKKQQKFGTMRTWTSADGQFEIKAEYRGTSYGKVRLRKQNGEEIKVPRNQLLKKDREWLKK